MYIAPTSLDLLGVVSSISLTVKNSTITLNWLSPFSLDIYNVDPDITYCVNVLNSTTHTVVDSQCGITETEYEYPVPPDAICHIYLFTVTPINVVGNGTTNFFSYFATRQRKYQCHSMYSCVGLQSLGRVIETEFASWLSKCMQQGVIWWPLGITIVVLL